MIHLFRRLRRSTRGFAAAEFGLMLPVLIVMLFGTLEVGRYVYLNMKLQNTAGNVADIISRPEQVASSDISSLFTAAPVMMRPFDAGEHLRIYISGVIVPDEDDPAEVAWQADGGGTLSATTQVGGVGDEADIPDGLVFFGGDAVIVAEVIYQYEPWLLGFASGGQIRKTAYFRPRRGTMAAIN